MSERSPSAHSGLAATARRYLPILQWGARYDRDTAVSDLVAAAIVTVMLIPQSLAYALLAGLPPQAGLYASILPLLAYGLFGTSRTLAVGPVAVVSLMTAVAVGRIAEQGGADYLAASVVLAALSGMVLLALGLLRLGFLANYLSHPVISGFITASGMLIALSQIKGVLGIDAHGHTLPDLLVSMAANLDGTNLPTLAIGATVTAFLFWTRARLRPWLTRRGLPDRPADLLARAAPVAAIAATIVLAWGLSLDQRGVAIVGEVPRGLPPFSLPRFDLALWRDLAVSAVLISVVGFVESVSVAQTLAVKRRQRISPDQELTALGAANLAAAVSGGYPVTGGFARSVVNFDAGAETPAAGMFTAAGVALAALALTPLLYFLPRATLSATIIVAVLSLVDLGAIRRVWKYSRADGTAMLATILVTLAAGVESGILAGVAISLFLHLHRTSRPHYAVVGQVPGTEHFRNVLRHDVVTDPRILAIRMDESLYFPNARFLEDRIYGEIAERKGLRHVVLMCSAVNFIDSSALESLESINRRLADSGVLFHLSEVKGPVMDRLGSTGFLRELTGNIYLTQFDAMLALSPEMTRAAVQSARAAQGIVPRGGDR